jgi:hypothetical protein
MGLILENNARGKLAQAATGSATTLVFEAGHTLPQTQAGEFYFLTLVNNLEGTERDIEIVKVTDMSGDTATVERGVDGTVAVARLLGETAEIRVNRALINALRQEYGVRLHAIETLLETNDTELDELQEIVNFIKQNREDLDALAISNIAGLEDALTGKVDKVTGKGLSDENYTLTEKNKLSGIAAGAQVNVATNIGVGTRTTTAVPITSSTGTGSSLPAATTALAGVMTSADKTKLDGIAAGAQVNVATNLSYTTSSRVLASSTGTNVTLPRVTTSADGLMIAADKTKLDGIAAGAQVNVATNIGVGTRTTTAVPITSSTGTGSSLPAATTALAGVMTSADKTKLDGIAAGAQVNVATNLSYTASSRVLASSTGTNVTLPQVTTSADGLMIAADKTKLDGIAAGANNYSLPKATSTTLGGVGVFSDTVQSVAANAVSTTASRTYGVQFDSSDRLVVNVPWSNTTYSAMSVAEGQTGTATTSRVVRADLLKQIIEHHAAAVNTDTTYGQASTSTLGLVKLGVAAIDQTLQTATTTAGRFYRVGATAGGEMYVNVPWADTNTTYSAGTGLSLSGTTFSNSAPNVTTNITTTHNATTVVVNSSDGTNGTINGATTTAAGVVTNAAQTWAGVKTLNSAPRSANGYETGSATMVYNSTSKSLDFNFA